MKPDRKAPVPDPLTKDRAERAVLLALFEGALDRGEHDRAETLRRQLLELGVNVRLGVVRPRRGAKRKNGGSR